VIDPTLQPAHLAWRNGQLHIESLAARDLAQRFGTPLYVYSAAALRDAHRTLAAAFTEFDPLLCFSLKSCGNIHIARVLVERGVGCDVVSVGELARARAAGCPPDRIVFAGVGKRAEEIRAALAARIAWFNVESPAELDMIAAEAAAMGSRARVALRLNPDVDARAHRHTTTGTADTKFGIVHEHALSAAARYVGHAHLSIAAVHVHLGSPVSDATDSAEGTRRAVALAEALAAQGHTITHLNLGGGFPVAYAAEPVTPPDAFAHAVAPILRVARLKLILEPGRFLAAPAGVLLTTAIRTKSNGPSEPTFVICDAGMHTLIRPALYDAWHFAWPTQTPPPRFNGNDPGPGLHHSHLVGAICETADHLARDRHLPPVAPGDTVAVFNAGAYGMTMASTYNANPLPAEVLVDGDTAHLIRRRQTLEELLQPELDCT
jgi:diaminopimelate decarboxylase